MAVSPSSKSKNNSSAGIHKPLAPSTNASSRTYLLFISTLIFVGLTGNILHHRIANPHNVMQHAKSNFEMNHLGGRHKLAHEELKPKKDQNLKSGVTIWECTQGFDCPPTPKPVIPYFDGENDPNDHSSSSSNRAAADANVAVAPLSHDLAGLSCKDHNGPADNIASEMIYWSDIQSDTLFKSPMGNLRGDNKRKYLTFEPDGGGFNNARMSMETIVVMAHAMGRTLVLPPSQAVYLLRKDRDKQRVHFSFNDFYHMDQIGYEHSGLDIITMDDFLQLEAMTGKLINRTSGTVAYPPNNRTNWDGEDTKPLKEYLRDVALTPLDWAPETCLAAFPSDDGVEHIQELTDMFEQVTKSKPKHDTYRDNPVPVNGTSLDRLREAASDRVQRLCIYDQKMQSADVIHFMCYHKMRVRLLTHFYAFLYFEDWRHDLWSKRFVRDHLRYSDDIQCAAARVVAAVRKRANKWANNIHGEFDSMHIRRGDFQYKSTQLDAAQIVDNIKNDIPINTTVFIATDHQNKAFFEPLAAKYDIVFLSDFKAELEGVNTNFFGMIDQLVASRGRIFFGCYHSTFSGFIFRMRGYRSQKMKKKGWEMGTMHNSFYYTGEKEKNLYAHYDAVYGAVYQREFPTSWRDIDMGIDEIQHDAIVGGGSHAAAIAVDHLREQMHLPKVK